MKLVFLLLPPLTLTTLTLPPAEFNNLGFPKHKNEEETKPIAAFGIELENPMQTKNHLQKNRSNEEGRYCRRCGFSHLANHQNFSATPYHWSATKKEQQTSGLARCSSPLRFGIGLLVEENEICYWGFRVLRNEWFCGEGEEDGEDAEDIGGLRKKMNSQR
ncbi:uncharacterized protein HKW66_Vig0117960 [Vigna angularis]|uniref:Uncharacterized protein n=1 Tax=Phaseolus angularis TaxID=3914 RepID=A0A8T0JVX0_PHAAN|nr:uncharacterized protein HKW66_Vig0117960 [Vigna angularis]